MVLEARTAVSRVLTCKSVIKAASYLKFNPWHPRRNASVAIWRVNSTPALTALGNLYPRVLQLNVKPLQRIIRAGTTNCVRTENVSLQRDVVMISRMTREDRDAAPDRRNGPQGGPRGNGTGTVEMEYSTITGVLFCWSGPFFGKIT